MNKSFRIVTAGATAAVAGLTAISLLAGGASESTLHVTRANATQTAIAPATSNMVRTWSRPTPDMTAVSSVQIKEMTVAQLLPVLGEYLGSTPDFGSNLMPDEDIYVILQTGDINLSAIDQQNATVPYKWELNVMATSSSVPEYTLDGPGTATAPFFSDLPGATTAIMNTATGKITTIAGS